MLDSQTVSARSHLLFAIFLVFLYTRGCPPCRWCLPAVFSSCPCCPGICAPCVPVLSSSCSQPSFCFLTVFMCRLHFALLAALLFVSWCPPGALLCSLVFLQLCCCLHAATSLYPHVVLLLSCSRPLFLLFLSSCGGEPLS